MKKLKYISLFTIAVILYSCGAASMKEEAEAPASANKELAVADSTVISMNGNAITESGTGLFADSLSKEQKEIFGKRAMQKLEDFNGYIAIMAGHFDTAMHNQAKTLAAELFDGEVNSDSLVQHTLLREIRDIFVNKNAEAVNDSLYKGELTFENQLNGEGRREHINFVIKKVNKSFGTEQRMVWEVYLSPHP